MEPINDPMDPRWKLSAYGSDVAQTGSSDTYSDHYINPDFNSMLETPLEDLDFLGNMDREQPSSEDMFPYQFTFLPPEYDLQNMSSGGTGFSATDLATDFSNAEFNSIQRFHTSNEPWSSQSLKSGLYDSGRIASIGPLESASDQSSCGTSPQSWISIQESAQNGIQPPIYNLDASLRTVGSGYSQLTWEEICIAADGLPKISEMIQKDSEKRQRGGRTGPLLPQTAEDARRMRKLNACWYCKTHKKKCSGETPCKPCLNTQKSLSPLEDRLCCRSIFESFGVLYFPDVLTSHLTPEEMEKFTSEHVGRMPNPGLPVGVTCGWGFQPMPLAVHVFEPKTDELTSHYHLVPANDGEALTSKPSAPVGILDVDLRDLKEQCKSYIQSMVAQPFYPRLEAPHDSGALGRGIRHQALSIVHRYSKLVKDPMLDRAMELHAMHHFMRTIIQFTDESAVTVGRESRDLLGYYFGQDKYESSRLLGRQLKTAMHAVQKEQTKKLLEDLECCLKKKEMDEWPTLFCVLIILCFATEDIQIAVDTFIVNDAGGFHKSRQSHRDCWNLEDKLSHQFTQLFHDVYQTHKRRDGFNPIQNENHSASWDRSTKAMLQDIKQLMHKYYSSMEKLSTLQVLDENQFQLENPSFIRDNPGRLVSKFLLSFRDRV